MDKKTAGVCLKIYKAMNLSGDCPECGKSLKNEDNATWGLQKVWIHRKCYEKQVEEARK